jgi:hypothetical protein
MNRTTRSSVCAALACLAGAVPAVAAPAARPFAAVSVDATAPVPPLAFAAAEARAEAAGEGTDAAGGPAAGLPMPESTPSPAPDAAALLADAARDVWGWSEATPHVALPAQQSVPAEVAPGVTATALRAPGMVLVALRRAAPAPAPGGATDAPTTAATPAPADPVRFDVRLPRGLWRADAALISADGAAPRGWRLEGALCPAARTIAKTLSLAPGQTLVLRFSETVSAAQGAAAACREFKGEGGSTYSGASVRTTLREVEGITASLPGFVAKGDRAALCKKVHRALLSAAQAQAMLENGRGSGLFEQEQRMNALVAALSEVSCAAAGLVPSQTVVRTNDDGTPAAVRVTLANAGPRTIPVVAVALAASGAAADAPRGMVQFIFDMGAATVPARPLP